MVLQMHLGGSASGWRRGEVAEERAGRAAGNASDGGEVRG